MKRSYLFIGIAIVQTAFLIAVMIRNEAAYTRGETIALKVVPVDPYDPFRGRYMILRYDINMIAYEQVTNDYSIDAAFNKNSFVLVELTNAHNAHQELSYYRAHRVYPVTDANRIEGIAIRGRIIDHHNNHIEIEYGIEDFFIPEDSDITESMIAGTRVRIAPSGEAFLQSFVFKQDETE